MMSDEDNARTSMAGNGAPAGGKEGFAPDNLSARAERAVLRTIVECGDFGVLACDTAGRIVVWNNWLAERTAVAAARVLGRTFAGASLDVSPALGEIMADVIRTGQPRILSPALHRELLPFTKPSQQLGRIYPLYDEKNAIAGVVLFLNDVAPALEYERFVEEKAQVERRDKESIFQAIGHPTFILDKEGRILDANREAARVAGCPTDAMIGRYCHEIMHGAEGPLPGCPLKKLRVTGVQEVMEIHVGRGIYQVSCTPLFAPNGDLDKVIHIAIDVTAQKRAEAAVIESEDKFRYVFEAANVGKSITAPTGEIFINAAFARMLGYRREELAGMTWQMLTPPEDMAATEEMLASLLRGERDAARFNKRYLHRDGSVVWTNVHVALRRDGAGRPLHFITTIIDITERKRAEEAETMLHRRLSALWRLAQLVDADEETFSEHVLAECLDITRSRYGFFGFIAPEEKVMHSYSHSRDAREDCRIAVRPLTFDIAAAGVWAEAVRQRKPLVINDYRQEHPGKKGLPAGHVPLTRLLSVPFLTAGKVSLIAAVANKETDYTPEDLRQLETFIANARMVLDKRRSDQILRQREGELRERDERFVKFASQVPGMIYQFLRRPDGSYCMPFTSDAVRGIFGCTPAEVRDDFSPIARAILPEDLAMVTAAIEASAARMSLWKCEYRVRLPGGPVRWMFGQALPEKLPDGSILWHGYNADVTEIKEAGEDLRQRSEELAAILDLLPAVVWIGLDPDCRVITGNRAANELTGTAPGTNISQTAAAEGQAVYLRQLKPDGSEYRPEELPMQRAVALGRPVRDAEIRFVFDGGRHVDTVGEAAPLFDAAGRVRGSVAAFADVTARKQIAAALQESEANFRRSLDESPLGVRIVSKAGETIYANRELLNIYGYESSAELRRTSTKARYTPDSYAEFLVRREKRRRGEAAPTTYEIDIVRKDGEIRHLQVYRKEILWSGVQQYQVLYNDITEREEAAQALRRSEERYRAFVRQSSEAICLFEIAPTPIDVSRPAAEQIDLLYERAVIGECNRIFAASHGFASPEEMTGFRLGQVLPRLSPENVSYLRRFLENDYSVSGMETREITRDAELKYYLKSMVGHVENGWLLRIWSVKQDISRIKEAEEEIRKLNAELELRVRQRTAELEAANRELEAFTYSVSHDLRAPLRAIEGYTRFLAEDYAAVLDQEGKRLCGVIEDNTRRMGRLIEELLAFSRLGRIEMRQAPIDMTELARTVFLELTLPADRERIDFRLRELPGCRGDATMMRQVWTNLLANAIKFSSRRERAVIEVSARQDEGETVYTVRDNGAGFDMRFIHKIFGVFQRLHSEKEFEGNGVGLSIVQRVISRHGGRVWAKGEVDRGAELAFALPRRQGERRYDGPATEGKETVLWTDR